MQRRNFLLAGSSAAVLSACGGTGYEGSGSVGSAPGQQNRFRQSNLVATSALYQPQIIRPQMVNAWGIAIRPAGAGGHFWVNGGGSSWEFVGDVSQSPTAALRTIGTDALTEVTIEGADAISGSTSAGKATGVVYNGAALTSHTFVPVGQQVVTDSGEKVELEGSARFIFVTDSGRITAWTERRKDNGAVLRHNGPTQTVFDGSTDGMSFFGCAMNTGTWDTLWVADFGLAPQIRQFNAQWKLVPTVGFANPFATGAGGAARPGDFVPFNISTVGSRVFVTYAKSQAAKDNPDAFFASEEDSVDAAAEKASGYAPDCGRLAEFTLNGNLVSVYQDEKHLNAPWGVEIAPNNFGAFSNAVLVGNFRGGGHIVGFDGKTGKFLGYLRGTDNRFIGVQGLWALQFGNGVSLGDKDALYFAAGPDDEVAGLFGSLRYMPA